MQNYFEGWYFKHQGNGNTLCLIPGRSDHSAFIQIITEDASYNVDFPLDQYRRANPVAIGCNVFSTQGITVNIRRPGLSLYGWLHYGEKTPLRYDIMGPFAPLPMQCKHSILSMFHRIKGTLWLNGQPYVFDGGTGYIEGDRGTSFPQNYVWVHSNDFPEPCSVTLAIAHIPFGLFSFRGCICALWHQGREYRLSTYTGAQVRMVDRHRISLSQGPYHLLIQVPPNQGHRLLAPQLGSMNRSIHETASTTARFVFSENRVPIFDYTSPGTSFEFVE